LPVIAHPPCKLWSKFAKANYVQWGGDHNKPGNDGGCFKFARAAVRKYGGVIEHPAGTLAWKESGISPPTDIGWQQRKSAWVCEVWQSAYGHRAAKATWLYYVGFQKPHDLNWTRFTGTHQIGKQDGRGKARNKPTLSKKEAEATPPAFREKLIELALNSNIVELGSTRPNFPVANNQFFESWQALQTVLKAIAWEYCEDTCDPRLAWKRKSAEASALGFTPADLSRAVQDMLASRRFPTP
jgi:hypothetical protein